MIRFSFIQFNSSLRYVHCPDNNKKTRPIGLITRRFGLFKGWHE